MSLNSVYFFRSSESLPGIFDSLFAGLFLVKGAPLLGQLAILSCFALAASAAWKAESRPRHWRRISLTSSLLLFIGISLFLLQPWDEVFINLRHSLNTWREGRFSFNAASWEEGTVETLPYLWVALLARLGVPVVDAGFIMSLTGGFFCLYWSYRLLARWGVNSAYAFLVLCLFPPIAYNASHGFGTAWFAGWILASIDLLFFEKQRTAGLVFLSTLPLIRVEGIALVPILLWLARVRWLSLLVLLPFVVHTAFRFYFYGHTVPLPVQYKSTFGNLFFLAVGIRNFVADSIATSTAALWLALAILGTGSGVVGSTQRRLLLGLALFTAAYYTSGGDWFPSYWGRYLFPLCLFTLLVFLSKFTLKKLPSLAIPGIFLLLSTFWPISSISKALDQVFSHRRTLAMIHEPTIGRSHYRVQNLSRLGEHLRRTSIATDRIGTSELATLCFFADRPCVDFLGLINPQIAQAPLRPTPSLIRQHPYRSELPFLIFRRLRPDLLAKTQPEFLYTFDFLLRDQLQDVRSYELTSEKLFLALARWEKQLGGLVDSLYGGTETILSLGYRPVIVQAGEDFSNLYFVHPAAWDRHVKALKEHGFTGGEIKRSGF